MLVLLGTTAGALTKSEQLGYVGTFPIPEIIRQINAFTLGARTANPSTTVKVRWVYSWYHPGEATLAANELIADGVDILASTENSPAVIQKAESEDEIFAFSYYSPMQFYGNGSTISGQLIHWEVIYEDILNKTFEATYTNSNLWNVDYLWFLSEKAVELGGHYDIPINEIFIDDLQTVNISTQTAYDYIFYKLEQMSNPSGDFNPFTGPIYAQNGTLMFAEGIQATIPDLFSYMNWFVEGVIGNPN